MHSWLQDVNAVNVELRGFLVIACLNGPCLLPGFRASV